MIFDNTIHVDITIPQSWQQCTIDQLEIIAIAISSISHAADGFHPFKWMDVKAAIFLPLAGLEVVNGTEHSDNAVKNETDIHDSAEFSELLSSEESENNPDTDSNIGKEEGKRTIWVRFTDKFRYLHRGDVKYQGIEEFPLTVWQVYSMIQQHLSWLGEDNDGNEMAPTIYNFPYPHLKCRTLHSKKANHHTIFQYFIVPAFYRISPFFRDLDFEGCGSLMQDFTWQRYRYAQDFMAAYIRSSNLLVRLRLHGRTASDSETKMAMDRQDEFCAKFLACCFTSRISAVDKLSGKTHKEYAWSASMLNKNAMYFRGLSVGTRWQVILLWWTSMQHYLQQKFPKCYVSSPVTPKGSRKKLPPNPLELYVRGVATLSKYLGMTEEEVNAQNFQIILQHMNDMADESERIDKMKK